MFQTVAWISGTLIYWLASIALVFLFSRMILDWIIFFVPTWKPQGIILVVANLVTAVTDPPLRFLRQRIPPLRFGSGMALDVGFMLIFVSMLFLQYVGITLTLWAN